MSLKYVGLISLILLLLIPLPQVAAQNTQGLYWGVTEDTRIDYHYASKLPDYSSGSTTTQYSEDEFDFYLVVNSLPDIPEYVSSPFLGIPIDAVSFYFSNDTTFNDPMGYGISTQFVIIPIGNWTLYTEFLRGFDNPQFQIEIVEDVNIWGFRQDYEIGDEESPYWWNQQNEIEISKSDGVLNNYSVISTNLLSDEVTFSIQLTRIGFPVIPIAFGFMVAIEAVIAVVIYKKYKGRTKKPVEKKADVNLDDLLLGLYLLAYFK